MKLLMTVEDALANADEWALNVALDGKTHGPLVACLVLATEVRRLRTALGNASPDMLERALDDMAMVMNS